MDGGRRNFFGKVLRGGEYGKECSRVICDNLEVSYSFSEYSDR